VDPVEQKISLSIKALTDREQRDALKKLASQQAQKQTTTLGDLLAEKLAEKAEEKAEDSGE
jgi:predicted RNA-binding protein with RPS1 domain